MGSRPVNRHDRAQALAKLALALMAERAVAPIPENFQLFYAYAAGDNPAVSRIMGDMIAQQKPFTPQSLDDLRDRFFRTVKMDAAIENIGAEVAGTMKTVLDRLAAAERDTEDYGRQLSAASGELVGDQSPAHLEKLVASLLSATRVMETRTKSLEEELQRSSHEVSELRTKLADVRRESLLAL